MALELPKRKTAFVCDVRMAEHFCIWNPLHPETPKRLTCALERCEYYNLVERCCNLESRFAKENELRFVHDEDYIQRIKKSKDITDASNFEILASNFDSLFFNPKSYDCALLAAGCTIDLVSSVINKKVENGLALVRPPGHHALSNEACGYCIFNNIAIAAKHALLNHNLERILIIDWDVHHGQSTQEIFYEDNRVLYFSIHRYEFGKFWPNLLESNFDHIGKGPGKGFNINVPLNKTGLGNTEYLAIFHNVLLPIAFEYNPQLVLISAGYDAALGCPEGEMKLSPYAYAHLLNELSGLANGRVCVIFEGGYFLPSLAEGVAATLRTLLGDPCPLIPPTEVVNESVIDTILNVITVLRPFWKCFSLQDTYISGEKEESHGNKHVLSTYSVGLKTLPGAPYPTRNCCTVHEENVYLMYEALVNDLINKTDLNVPRYRTGFYVDGFVEYKKEFEHVSKTQINVMEKLKNSGLMNKCFMLDIPNINESEFDHMKSVIIKVLSELKNFDSVNILDNYNQFITLSANLLRVLDCIVTEKCMNGFSHIKYCSNETIRFSLIDLLVIASKYAISKYSSFRKPVKKILIFSCDVHENTMQHVNYGDENILCISFCHYGNNVTSDSIYTSFEMHGSSNAGYNINIPWKSNAKCGDYLASFFHIVLPVAYEFCPDLILISGFNDPNCQCDYSELYLSYEYIIKLLSGLANGRIIFVMKNESKLVTEFTYNYMKILMGEPCSSQNESFSLSNHSIEVIQKVTEVYEKVWKSLRFRVKVPYLDSSLM